MTDLALAVTGFARLTAPCLNLAAAVVAGLVVRMVGSVGAAFEVVVDSEVVGGPDVAPNAVLNACGAEVADAVVVGALDSVAVGGSTRPCVVMLEEGGTAGELVVGAAVGLPLSMFCSMVAI